MYARCVIKMMINHKQILPIVGKMILNCDGLMGITLYRAKGEKTENGKKHGLRAEKSEVKERPQNCKRSINGDD